jgi:hypothetical protein
MPFGPEHNSTMGESLDRQVKEEEPPPWPFPTGKAPAPVDERQAFEKWLRAKWTMGYGCPRDGDKYADPEAQSLWESWPAALALAQGLSPFDKWFEDQQLEEQHRYICKLAYEAGRNNR